MDGWMNEPEVHLYKNLHEQPRLNLFPDMQSLYFKRDSWF